eukprot:429062_1
MSSLFKVPIINIKPLIAHGPDMSQKIVRDCINSMHIACRDIGFLGLKGHNISREIRKEILEMSRQFFALDSIEKNKIHISKYNNCIGYQYFGENVTENKRDKHEGIDYYKYTNNTVHSPFNISKIPYPLYPSSFESIFNEYINECLKFGELIMSAMALCLHLPYDYFKPLCNKSFYVLRILHYPMETDDNNYKEGETFSEFGCGEHRDYGCLTFINCDNTMDCLEIKDTNNIFRKVNVNTIDEDCFIVNIGDMINLWSGGLYQSTPHRVLTPKKKNVCNESIQFNKQNNSNIGRISIPFFYEPNWDTVIKPIVFDMEGNDIWNNKDKIKWKEMEEFRNNAKQIMYGDHLKSKVFSNFY